MAFFGGRLALSKETVIKITFYSSLILTLVLVFLGSRTRDIYPYGPSGCTNPTGCKQNGYACTDDTECISGSCNPTYGLCEPAGGTGAACNSDGDCLSGVCDRVLGCLENYPPGGICHGTEECGEGYYCDGNTSTCIAQGTCPPGYQSCMSIAGCPDGTTPNTSQPDFCAPDGQSCPTGYECGFDEACLNGVCKGIVASGDHCYQDGGCASGCCYDQICRSSSYCGSGGTTPTEPPVATIPPGGGPVPTSLPPAPSCPGCSSTVTATKVIAGVSCNVVLNWSDVANESSYLIYRNGIYLTSVAGNVTLYNDTGVACRASQTYMVRPYKSGCSTPICSTATAGAVVDMKGVVFIDDDPTNARQDGNEHTCYDGSVNGAVTISAVTNDGGPSRSFTKPFTSVVSCNQYSLPVESGRSYRVTISGLQTGYSITGWNKCDPSGYTPGCEHLGQTAAIVDLR